LPIGCVSHPRAQNPLPGVFRVAVIPFNDKTGGAEGLDTLEFTKIFAVELQQVPSFEVVPVQEVVDLLNQQKIDTNQPELAYALARALHVQAIVVGDITEYQCYYPLRVGLHCEMYCMVTGQPQALVQDMPQEGAGGINLDNVPSYLRPVLAPFAGKHLKDPSKGKHGCHDGQCADCKAKGSACGKAGCKNAPAAGDKANAGAAGPGRPNGTAPPAASYTPSGMPRGGVAAGPPLPPPPPGAANIPDPGPAGPNGAVMNGRPQDMSAAIVNAPRPMPIVEPWVIRHSRVFDANNLGFVRKIRQYYFFEEDLRGGDWQGFVERTDDFNRFICDRMIYEMLEAAGGKWETLRGFSFPHPWEPWPWR
jgi:hypothetical protein